jgi:ribosome-associated translation inhibitor RaiA
MQIHWELDDVDPDARAAVKRRLRRLGRIHADLIDVRIAVSPRYAPGRTQREVRITSLARRGQITAAHACLELARGLQYALDATERELRSLRDRVRHRRSTAAL